MVSALEDKNNTDKYLQLDSYYDQARAQNPIRAVFGYARFLGDLFSRQEDCSEATAMQAERHLLRRSLNDGGPVRNLALLRLGNNYLHSPARDAANKVKNDRRGMQCYAVAVAESPDQLIVREEYMCGCITVFEHLSALKLNGHIPINSEVPQRAKIAYGGAVNSVANLLATGDLDREELCIRKLAYLTRWKIDGPAEGLLRSRVVPHLAKLLREGKLREEALDSAIICLKQLANQGCAQAEIEPLLKSSN